MLRAVIGLKLYLRSHLNTGFLPRVHFGTVYVACLMQVLHKYCDAQPILSSSKSSRNHTRLDQSGGGISGIILECSV